MATKVQIDLEVRDNTKSLKAQFAEAKKELQAMAAAYGENSQQAIEAAKRAAELKDIIDDSGEAIKNLQGGGAFTALGNSISSVASGFSAVQGALGVIGVEGAAVEETLLKVQSAMALAQGLQGLEDAGRSFGALKAVATNAFNGMTTAGKAFAVTGIGLILTGIATAISYADELKEVFGGVSVERETLNKVNQKAVEIAAEELNALDKLKVTINSETISREDKNKAVAELQAKYPQLLANVDAEKLSLTDLNAVLNKNIKLTELRAKAQAIEAVRAEEYKNKITEQTKALNLENVGFLDQTKLAFNNLGAVTDLLQGKQESINKIYKEASKVSAENLKESNALSDRKIKFLDKEGEKLAQNIKSLETELGVSDEQKKKAEEATKAAEQARQRAKQATDERIAQLKRLREFEQGILDDRLTDQEREVLELTLKFEEEFKIAKKYKQDLTILEEGFQEGLKKINQKYLDEEKQAFDEMNEAKKKKDADAKEAERLNIEAQLKANADKNLKLGEQDLKAKENAILIEQAKVDQTIQGLQLVSEIADLFAKKDEASARKAFQIQKAVSLAETTIKTIQAVQNAFTSASASPITVGFPAYPFIQAGLAGGFGAVQLAKIASTQFNGGGSGSSISGSSSGGLTGANTSTPQFNIVGQANTNPLQQFDGVLKAYVVGSDVTTQQQLDRERIDAATFG